MTPARTERKGKQMNAPRFIPEYAGSQAMLVDNPNGTICLTVHTYHGHCSMDLSPAHALELADDLRFRALSMQADAAAVGAK
jgi:hypothetical protein